MDVSAPQLAADPIATLRSWSLRAWSFTHSDAFGDAIIILFFVAQALDGLLTYVGVNVMGPDVEGNPLLRWLMMTTGQGPALALAKLTAAGFGVVLHLASVHRALAVLTVVYLAFAVVPWIALLLLMISRGLV